MANKQNVIEFYNSALYIPGILKPNELTDDILNQLSDTLIFARWMLANKYKECVESIKRVLKALK